jgi:hypothetical protein
MNTPGVRFRWRGRIAVRRDSQYFEVMGLDSIEGRWDAEIERDFSADGAGMELLLEIDAEIDAGKFENFKVSRPRD